MQSRYEAESIEAEYEPGSRGRVLRNLMGIRHAREMARVESERLLQTTDRIFGRFTEGHRFTAADVCEMHREWLSGIYVWAGRYRSVNIARGDFQFAAAAQVPRLMEELERGPLFRYTPCREGSLDLVSRAIAEVHAEVVLIHPFREGNGRCARILTSLMSLQAGLPPLDFGGIKGEKKRAYISAVHAALARDYEPMTRVFKSVVNRTLRIYGGQRKSWKGLS